MPTDPKSITLAEHMANMRARQDPMQGERARRLAAYQHASRLLARLRPVVWPPSPLSTSDAAFILNCSPVNILHLIAAGSLTAKREGKSYRITEDALRAYLWRRLDEARELGLSIPQAARQVAGRRATVPESRRNARTPQL